ncbi:hypothetical protein [Cupriavidus sp. DL-D2]|uniref:hypothetical protein n=1 Tax=Cupriavidus sp. DL-D2 TaxID=3144974 RepID=UPI0032129083
MNLNFKCQLPPQLDPDTIVDALSGVLTAFDVLHTVETTHEVEAEADHDHPG